MIRKIIIILFSSVSLVVLAGMAAWLSQGQTEFDFVQRSRHFAKQYNYVAALETLDLGLGRYPESEVLSAEFRKDSELYIVHEISKGYQRIDQDPKDIQAYIRISDAFWLAGQKSRALEVLVEGTFENPESSALWAAIGNIEKQSGRPQEAISAFEFAKRYESIK